MSKIKLYLPEGKELEELRELYPTASKEQLDYWTKKFGYRNRKAFQTAMRDRQGLSHIPQRIEVKEVSGEEARAERPVVVLPAVKLYSYKAPKVEKGDEEIMVVVDGDEHDGKVTDSYNPKVFEKRVETKYHSIITIAGLHRKIYPINKLVVLKLGDGVQGENPKQGSRLEEVEGSARHQVLDYVRVNDNYLSSLCRNFETVEVDGFPGNHGRYDRDAPATSNWDLFAYDLLKAGIAEKIKNLSVNICENPAGMEIVNIWGWKFLVFHGDAVRAHQGIPFFALSRRIKEWYMQFKGFHYAVCGHFHKLMYDEVASEVELFLNSTLVSNDPWALKKLGISSKPRQWCFGVHPRKGVTWAYRLIVEKGEFEYVVRDKALTK